MAASEKFWNRIASKPGKAASQPSQTFLKTLEGIRRYSKSSDVVLDYGCGTGGMSLAIAGEVKRVHGIDISTGMIAVAQERADEGEQDNVLFEQRELFDPQLEHGAYDLILVLNVLHYIKDGPAEVQRLHQLLKPEGLFISSTACLAERKSPLNLLLFLLGKMGLVPRMERYEASQLEELIRGAGFTIREAKNISNIPERFLVASRE